MKVQDSSEEYVRMLSKIERMNQQFGSLNKNGANAPKLTDEMINMMFAENNGIGVDKLASLLGGMGKVEPAAMKTLIDETQKKLKVFDNDDDCEGDSSDNDDDEDLDEDEEEEIEDEESSSRSHSDEFQELEPVPNGDEIEAVEDKTPQKKKDMKVENSAEDKKEKADKSEKKAEKVPAEKPAEKD